MDMCSDICADKSTLKVSPTHDILGDIFTVNVESDNVIVSFSGDIEVGKYLVSSYLLQLSKQFRNSIKIRE